MSRTIIDPSIAPGFPVNILDNGGFEIWQRGTSFASISTNNVYTADRWCSDISSGAVMTISQNSANVDSGSFSMDMNITTVGTGSASMKQLIENYADFFGKTVTCSIRVKTSLTGFHIELFDGVGGVTAGASHSGSGNFETITCTRTISASATSFRIYFGWPSQPPSSTGHSYIDSAMLTVSSAPVSFIPINPEVDLARCQRFYHRLGGNISGEYLCNVLAYTTSNYLGAYQYPVRMRIAPTITVTNGSSFQVQANQSIGAKTTTDVTPNTTSPMTTAIQGDIGTASFVQGQFMVLATTNTTNYIEFSADL